MQSPKRGEDNLKVFHIFYYFKVLLKVLKESEPETLRFRIITLKVQRKLSNSFLFKFP